MAAPIDLEIEANGLRFETLVAGPRQGEPVILLHGYPQSAAAWRDTMEWLAAQGYRSIAPNLRGYSPGANPADPGQYAMGHLVADVLGIADAQGVSAFHLVGHDWGGALAWAVAARHPERLLSLTVLSTPHMAAMLEAMRTSMQSLRSSYMAFFRLPRLPETLLQAGNFAQLGLSVRAFGLPREAWLRDRRQLQRVGGVRGALNWYRGATRGTSRQRRITVPTLFIWGRRDPFLGRRAAELTAKYVTGPYRFEEVDGGHWLTDRNLAEVERLILPHLRAHAAPERAVSDTPAPPAERVRGRRARAR